VNSENLIKNKTRSEKNFYSKGKLKKICWLLSTGKQWDKDIGKETETKI
jgi:hypothetical protein